MSKNLKRIELFPIFDRCTVYNDHFDGELAGLGDALGRDCMIAAFDPRNVTFMALYQGDGSRNEDWFSWNAKVYAPISGEVVRVFINEVTNLPGNMNPSPSSVIDIRGEDGTVVTLAHIQDPVVCMGQRVEEGQHVAYVGNNGFSRNPHVHVGAHREGEPLMIGFDAQKVGEVRRKVDECYWLFGISDAEYISRFKR